MIALITGATGLVGSYLIRNYLNKFVKIYNLGRKKLENTEFIEHDLRLPLKENLPNVDVVLHFAGQTGVYTAEMDVINDHNINTLGMIHLLNALKIQQFPPFFINLGSATQIGYTDSSKPIGPNNQDNPITFYDLSKLCAEKYLMSYIERGWIRGCSLRLCNVFGASNIKQNKDRGIIDKVFSMAMKNEDIYVYDDGLFKRDYIYIDDVINAIFNSIKSHRKLNGEYFFIGSGKGIFIKDAFSIAVNLAFEITQKKSKIIFKKAPSDLSLIDKRSFVSDITSFTEKTKWFPKYDLRSGLIRSYCKKIEKK